MKSKSRFGQFILLTFFMFAVNAWAQTSAFTYQGRLTDGAAAANGSYDFQFALFDSEGVQLTPSVSVSNVTVASGIFTVQLDFGANAFPGDQRFLQIAVKKPAEPDYTLLSPRQPITSAPYAVKSLNAETAVNSSQLGGITAGQYVQTNDTRLSDERSPLAGSSNYIQNTNVQQSSANFNVSGTGTAGIFNAMLQYNLNGSRLLAAPTGTQNTFTGIGSGAANAAGNFNSFYGFNAGLLNTTGGGNSFFGTQAGFSNTTGSTNSFFGRSAGNTNSTGGGNSFFGVSAGGANTIGNGNTFLGGGAGFTNTTGFQNTLVGTGADVGVNNLNHATAIGAGAVVGTSNTIVLGRPNGFDRVEIPGAARANIFNAATEFQINNIRVIGVGGESSGTLTSLFVGYNAGASNTSGISNTFVGRQSGFANNEGDFNSFFGYNAGLQNTTASNNSFFGSQAGGANTTGIDNAFFGARAGSANLNAEKNSFFGAEAGFTNTSGSNNSFFGYVAGRANTNGSFNTFIGYTSGVRNTTGNYNAYLGHFSGFTPRNATRVTLLGAFTDAFDNLDYATAIGAGARVTTSDTIVLGRPNGADKVVVPGLGEGGDLQLCWNASLQIARCASSLRFKTNIKSFAPGLNLVRRLQPITFEWTTNGRNDLGLGAEEVAAIEPLLVTYDQNGQIQGVKYDRIGVVLLNAVREQQTQIENQEKHNAELKTQIELQQKQIEEQKQAIDGLRSIVCAQNPRAALCRAKEDERDEK